MDVTRFSILLRPSLASMMATAFVSTLTLGIATQSYLSGSGVVYDFLFGPNSSSELIRSSQSTLSAFNNTVFGNPTLNKILYFAMWMLIGLITYMLLYGLSRGAQSAAEDVEEAGYANTNKKALLRNIGRRLALRLIVFIAWWVYIIFFVKILLPFSILAARIGAGNLPTLGGWLYGLLGLAVLAISLHIHVIFVRLLVLRVRLFNAEDEDSMLQ